MTRPLYNAACQKPKGRAANGHAGLWFDKFCDQWHVSDNEWTMSSNAKGDNPKLQWIRDLTRYPVGEKSLITEHVVRQMKLAKARGGRSFVFKTESRFVTGIGHSHPVENGFAWHPVLGTPFLPGSSIKGVVRAWAQADPQSKTRCQYLLGHKENTGYVCFLDAIPFKAVRLEADIITPHYAGWSEEDPPGDWHSPTPIPFLVTPAQTSFLFSVIPCHVTVTADDLTLIWNWLSEALAWTGGGAKTAIGYGRFKRVAAPSIDRFFW